MSLIISKKGHLNLPEVGCAIVFATSKGNHSHRLNNFNWNLEKQENPDIEVPEIPEVPTDPDDEKSVLDDTEIQSSD